MAARKRPRDDDDVVEAYAWEGEMEKPWESIEEDEVSFPGCLNPFRLLASAVPSYLERST